MTLTSYPELGAARIALADDESIRAAHLLRRAGFTPTRAEIDRAVERGYEATVDELLHPENRPDLEIEDLIRRYHVDQNSLMLLESSQGYWMYRIINSQRPLEEKIALFWHGLFATAYGKLNHAKAVVNQTHTFRRHGLGKFADILVELSRDPAMIFWLDNKDNHRDAPNENYGRELLELFSMGIGNYTEADVKAAARAFTGWTIDNTEYMSIRASRDSFWPYGRIDWQFRYREDDHDDTEKTFLGHTGPLSGQDVIDIIVKQPPTAHYIAGKLYNFFVSDRPDEEAVGILADEFTRTDGDIRAVMRCMFLSDFFADEAVRLGRVKSPAELVGGTARLGRQPPHSRVDHLQPGHGRQLHGPGDPEPSHGGGLAHRHGVDRYRQPRRAHQRRRRRDARYRPARRPRHHRKSKVRWKRARSASTGRSLPQRHGHVRGVRRYHEQLGSTSRPVG